MDVNRIRAASAACFLSAALGFLYLPSFAWMSGLPLQLGIPLASVGLYAFFMITLSSILRDQLRFAWAPALVNTLIAGFGALAVASVLDEISSALVPVSLALVVGGVILVGLGSMVLGYKLWSARGLFGNLVTAYSVLLFVQGSCFASVVGIAAGIQVAGLADLVLGLILLRFARTPSVYSPLG